MMSRQRKFEKRLAQATDNSVKGMGRLIGTLKRDIFSLSSRWSTGARGLLSRFVRHFSQPEAAIAHGSASASVEPSPQTQTIDAQHIYDPVIAGWIPPCGVPRNDAEEIKNARAEFAHVRKLQSKSNRSAQSA